MSGVGARADVQQVVALSGKGSGSLVVQSAAGSAAGAFLTLLLERVMLRLASLSGRVGVHASMLAAALSPTCAGLDCCWDGSSSPLLMGGRSVFLLRLSRSLAVGL